MKLSLTLLILLLFAAPVQAWRLGAGFQGGLVEEEPSVILHAELDSPGSHWHLQPRFQVWKPEDQPGVWELGLDAFWHHAPCEAVSLYLGGGLGVEWLPQPSDAEPPAPCDCETPEPEPVDPPEPTAVAIAGIRFPSAQVDGFLEARHTFSDWNERSGVFAGVTFHERRSVRRTPLTHH